MVAKQHRNWTLLYVFLPDFYANDPEGRTLGLGGKTRDSQSQFIRRYGDVLTKADVLRRTPQKRRLLIDEDWARAHLFDLMSTGRMPQEEAADAA